MTTTERSDRARVWLLMSLLPEERQYGGNDGYEDDVSRFYSWNSRVPNAEAISAGDSVILWDKKGSTRTLHHRVDHPRLQNHRSADLSALRHRQDLVPQDQKPGLAVPDLPGRVRR